MVAMRLCQHVPDGVTVNTRDGRLLSVDLSTGMQSSVFFLGEYERAITRVLELIIERNGFQRFVDAGANFGWYTSLFYKYAAEFGEVHAFEPVPPIFENLERNYRLMGSPSNVRINRIALGDEKKRITVNLFEGLSTGHASISDQGRDDAIGFECPLVTLDDYLAENRVSDIDLVKVDIEGAELSFLKGAESLFRQRTLPVILMEMALNQTKNFGYLPNDLIDFIRERGAYHFYKIDEIRTRLVKIDGIAADDIGANVICIPESIREYSIRGLV
jgi:FkbM family methyltransferase